MTEPKRPTPEELLKRYALADEHGGHQPGRLRVFLGAAPGVGKTYAMLTEGRRLKAAGHDVVVGFVETHGRVETLAQLGDLEVIPRVQVTYRGVTLDEMDTDAVLKRKPEIALVDELAHTNAPGSARAKRYEDVELLRDAGIDVITTVNVQHLDSLQDVVAGITGVRVRETIPDQLLDDADVQLVDLPSDELLERLAQGKIYPPARAAKAMQHFFREGNLTALRELALRRTAAGVNEQLESYMRENAIEDVWPAAERVLVMIDHRPSAGTVLRHAWRLASALRSDLVAVTAVPPGGLDALPSELRRGLERNLQLVEDLGGSTRIVEDGAVAPALATVVREENPTLVVLGYVPRGRWRRLVRPSLSDRLLGTLDHVAIHLVEVGAVPRPSRPA